MGAILPQKRGKPKKLRRCCTFEGFLMSCGSYLGAMMGYLGVMLGHVGSSWPILALCYLILALCWAVLAPTWAKFGIILGHLGAYLRPSWRQNTPKTKKHEKTREKYLRQVGAKHSKDEKTRENSRKISTQDAVKSAASRGLPRRAPPPSSCISSLLHQGCLEHLQSR